jgi:DnaJ family protein C protein 3
MLFLLSFVPISCYNQNQQRRVEQLMQFHRFWDALTELNTLIQREGQTVPTTLYKLRAQCYLNMAMCQECIDDAARILKNKPSREEENFAHILQARAYIQLGEYEKAESAVKPTGDRDSLRTCQELRSKRTAAANKAKAGQVGEAAQLYDFLLRQSPKATQLVLERSDLAWMSQDLGRFKELTNDLEEKFPDNAVLAYRRGILHFCDGQIGQAMTSLKRAGSLRGAPKNCSASLSSVENVNNYYPQAQQQIEKKRSDEAQKSIDFLKRESEPHCPSNSVLMTSIANLEMKLVKITRTEEEFLEFLNKEIERNPDSMELLLERGELHTEMENYDAALFDFATVQRKSPNKRAQEGVAKAQDLKKKANYVDHYKALGLTKESNPSNYEIKEAYKKKVREWHPDRFGDPEKKKEAETMMKNINRAYDILGNDQQRRMYDSGQDPEEGGGGGGGFGFNPFDMFFGQGGQGFRFEFGGGQAFHFHM